MTDQGGFGQVSPSSTLKVCPCPAGFARKGPPLGSAECGGAEGAEEVDPGCRKTASARHLSPLSAWSLGTGVSRGRPLSLTDFGDSLVECDQAEQDFRKLSLEVLETTEASAISNQPGWAQQVESSRSAAALVPDDSESTQANQKSTRHIEEVSRRLYKVLYRDQVHLMASNNEDVSVMAKEVIQAQTKEEGVSGAAALERSGSAAAKSVCDPTGASSVGCASPDVTSVKPDVSFQKTLLSQYAPEKVLSVPSPPEGPSSGAFDQMSRDFVCGLRDIDWVDASVGCSFEKQSFFGEIEPETETFSDSSLETEESAYRTCSPLPSVFDLSDFVPVICCTTKAVASAPLLVTESRPSSPESASSNELSCLAPNSPVPHFRPLSPLPPPVFPWDSLGQEQPFLGAPKAVSAIMVAEQEERPLTPMVPNNRPFGSPVSLGWDYSTDGSHSPPSATFDIEDRGLSPLSVGLEERQWLFTSSDHGAKSLDSPGQRPSSPDSLGSNTACCPFPSQPLQDSGAVPEGGSVLPEAEFNSAFLVSRFLENRPMSPRSVRSESAYGCTHGEARASSPASAASPEDLDRHPEETQATHLAKDPGCAQAGTESGSRTPPSVSEDNQISLWESLLQATNQASQNLKAHAAAESESPTQDFSCEDGTSKKVQSPTRSRSTFVASHRTFVSQSYDPQHVGEPGMVTRAVCVYPEGGLVESHVTPEDKAAASIADHGAGSPLRPDLDSGRTESPQTGSLEDGASSPNSRVSVNTCNTISAKGTSAEACFIDTTGLSPSSEHRTGPKDSGEPGLKPAVDPAYKPGHDAPLWRLISQIRDPHYSGGPVSRKTGLCESVGAQTGWVQEYSAGAEGESEEAKGCALDSSDADVLQQMRREAEGGEESEPGFQPQSTCRASSPGAGSARGGVSSAEQISNSAESCDQERQPVVTANLLIGQLFDPQYAGEAAERRGQLWASSQRPLPLEAGTRQSLGELFTQAQTPSCSPHSEGHWRALSFDSPTAGLGPEVLISTSAYRCRSVSAESLSDTEGEHESWGSAPDHQRPSSPEPVRVGDEEQHLASGPPVRDEELERFPTFVGFEPVYAAAAESKAFIAPPGGQRSPSFHMKQQVKERQPEVLSRSEDKVTSTMQKSNLGSSSPDDWETDLCMPWSSEDRAPSPGSLASTAGFDSPVPDFRPALAETPAEFVSHTSSSPECEGSDGEYAPVISPISEFERAESCRSGASESELRCLSPDSPLPPYALSAPLVSEVKYESSSSPEVEHSDEDVEADLFMPWFWEDRASSPDSSVSTEEVKPLSPDSPIPEFTQVWPGSYICHHSFSSCSPDSESSDLELELPWASLWGSRPPSPPSQSSCGLSADSPVADFGPDLAVSVLGRGSDSFDSACSDEDDEDDEYIVFSLGSHGCDHRPWSPDAGQSGASADCSPPPDSPVPDYTPATNVIVNAGYRSSSPESMASDIEFAVGEILSARGHVVENRGVSPESLILEGEEDKPLSPGAAIRSASPEGSRPSPRSLASSVALESPVSAAGPALERSASPATDGWQEKPAVMVAEYHLIYDAEMWKLMSQVLDPPYAGEAFKPQTGFMQLIGYTTDSEAAFPDTERDRGRPGEPDVFEDVQVFPGADEAWVESPPPMIEERPSSEAARYRPRRPTWEKLLPAEHGTDAKHQPCAGDSHPPAVGLMELSPGSGRAAADSSERGTRPLAEVASWFPEVRSWSPDSLPECRPMSLDGRASSPESWPQFGEDRSLSPDSPVPQFTAWLEDRAAVQPSSSAGSPSSDSECELLVSSALAQTDRPSSAGSLSSLSLPDSPVPDFMMTVSSCFVEAACSDGSPSPVSSSSGTEFVALPIDCWIDDSPRPASPPSVDSAEELGLSCPRTDALVSESLPLSHVTPSLSPDHSLLWWSTPPSMKSEVLDLEHRGLQPEQETSSPPPGGSPAASAPSIRVRPRAWRRLEHSLTLDELTRSAFGRRESLKPLTARGVWRRWKVWGGGEFGGLHEVERFRSDSLQMMSMFTSRLQLRHQRESCLG